jgi:hypothetical protein
LSIINPDELYLLLSDSLSSKTHEFQNIPEIGLNLEPISQNEVVKFLFSFLPIREVVWNEKAENNLSNECFDKIYSNYGNTDLSILLSDEKDLLCDVIDFDNIKWKARFNSSKGIWTSRHFSNMQEAIVCFNPSCMVIFFEDNVPVNYFSMVISSNQSLILQSRSFEILTKFKHINILYTPCTKELNSILELLIFYCKFYWGVDVFLKFNVDTFTVCFTFGLEANIIQYMQFNSNVQSHFNKLIGTNKADIERLNNSYPLTIVNTIIEERKMYSLECPTKIEYYQAVLHSLLILMNKSTYFNLICCK